MEAFPLKSEGSQNFLHMSGPRLAQERLLKHQTRTGRGIRYVEICLRKSPNHASFSFPKARALSASICRATSLTAAMGACQPTAGSENRASPEQALHLAPTRGNRKDPKGTQKKVTCGDFSTQRRQNAA